MTFHEYNINYQDLDGVDRVVIEWISDGIYDDAVRDRLISLREKTGTRLDDLWQKTHRRLHADGPYGWEFCSRCESMLSEI